MNLTTFKPNQMNKQPHHLYRHEIIKLLIKRMDYTMQSFADDAKVNIATIFNWMRKPESCRSEAQVETAFLGRVEQTKVIPVKKAKAILRNSELTLNISQSEYIRVMMDRHKITVDALAKESGIERNQVYFWTQGKKEGIRFDETLKNYFTKAIQNHHEALYL
jgi:hypothetical protein